METDNSFELDAPSTTTESAPAASAEVSTQVPASPQPGAQPAGGSAGGQEPGSTPSVQDTAAQAQARTISEEQWKAHQAQTAQREAAYQRSLQEAAARQRAYEDRMFELQTAQLPPEQKQALQAQREFAQREAQLREAATRQQEQIRALEPVFEEMVVRELLDTYRNVGVTRADLKRFNTPEAMEAFCEASKERHRATQVKARAQTGVDAAAASGSGAKPAAKADWRSQSLSDQLRDAFRD